MASALVVWNFCRTNRPFAASHSRGTKPPCWRAKVALGQDKQKTYPILNSNFLCLSCPRATFSLQHGSFVPREWLATKGLLVVSDRTIFVVYKMLVICSFRSLGRQIKCGAAKTNVLSIRFLWAKSRSNSRGLQHTPPTRTRWSIT